MAKHHPDLIFCRKQPGVGKLTKLKIIEKRQRFYEGHLRTPLHHATNTIQNFT